MFDDIYVPQLQVEHEATCASLGVLYRSTAYRLKRERVSVARGVSFSAIHYAPSQQQLLRRLQPAQRCVQRCGSLALCAERQPGVYTGGAAERANEELELAARALRLDASEELRSKLAASRQVRCILEEGWWRR